MGVDIETNMVIGKVLTIDELMHDYGYEAVYVASGAGLPRFMDIPGESLKGVYSANEYLTRVNLMKAYKEGSKTPIKKSKNVAVVGGGNVAMDAARSASVWVPRTCTSCTAAAWKSCPPVRKRWSMPRKRASSSSCSPIPCAFWATRTAA